MQSCSGAFFTDAVYKGLRHSRLMAMRRDAFALGQRCAGARETGIHRQSFRRKRDARQRASFETPRLLRYIRHPRDVTSGRAAKFRRPGRRRTIESPLRLCFSEQRRGMPRFPPLILYDAAPTKPWRPLYEPYRAKGLSTSGPRHSRSTPRSHRLADLHLQDRIRSRTGRELRLATSPSGPEPSSVRQSSR